MLKKLEEVVNRYKQLEQQLSDPETFADNKLFAKLNKEYKGLHKICAAIAEYRNVMGNIQSTKDILFKEKDDEMKEMARAELETLTAQQFTMEEELKVMLTPKDPEDAKDCIIEIRGGTG